MGNEDTTGTVNLDFVKGYLANLESIRSFYIDEFGLGDIGTSPDEIKHLGIEKDGIKFPYKVKVTKNMTSTKAGDKASSC